MQEKNTIVNLPCLDYNTAWKVSEYGTEKTPYLDTFHAVTGKRNILMRIYWFQLVYNKK